MAYEDFKVLTRRTASDKILPNEVFGENLEYDGCQSGLASIVYPFFDKTSASLVDKTYWKRYEDKKKCLLGISVSNKYTFHKFMSDKSKANPKYINYNPIISIYVLFWKSKIISILRIKISDDCLVL